jgi:hypothetical protein
VSYYYNFWDKNLRRTPTVSGDCVADIRYNVVRNPVQSGIQIRDGARANLVGNAFEGPRALIASALFGGYAYLQNVPSELRITGDLTQPVPVPHLPPAKPAAAVVGDAGALPRDTADRYFIDVATTLDQVRAKTFPQ